MSLLKLTPGGLLAQGDLERLCAALARGGCSVIPTDTGYMMAVDALSEASIARLYTIKGRPETNPVHVAVASLAKAEALAEVSDTARKLARALLPGPLTIVCPKRAIVPDSLVAGSGTVGSRSRMAIGSSSAILRRSSAAFSATKGMRPVRA